MTLHELNTLPPELLREELAKCCGSTAWVNKMVGFFPMDDLVEFMEDAEEQWYDCTEADWKEAFAHHPKIGDNNSSEIKTGTSANWPATEQSAVGTASPTIRIKLAEANIVYENKFGYIFIVFATGKTAEEMLGLLLQRLSNIPEEEIRIAMEEQNKITLLRLQKMIA